MYLGQCTSVVDHEMVNADGPVTLDTVGLAAGLAVGIGILSADISPDNNKVSNIVIALLFVIKCGKLPY